MSELVSVIIPIYNSQKKIKKTIQSIVDQTYENLQILLIDDGSTDQSLSICRGFENIDERIDIYTGENLGVSHARNTGLKASKGKYIYFIDSDDYIENNTIETLVTNIEKYEADISIIGYSMYWDNGKVQKMSNPDTLKILGYEDAIKEWFSSRLFKGFMWDKMFRSELFKDIFFPESLSYMEDVYIGNKLFLKSQRVVYNGENLYMYYQSNQNITNGAFKKEYLEGLESIKFMVDFSINNGCKYDEAAYSRLIQTSYDFIEKIYNSKLEEEYKAEIKELLDNIKNHQNYIFSQYIKKINSFFIFLLAKGISPKLVTRIRSGLLNIKRRVLPEK
ncbi:glycosyltransferase family 2 protein [Carnobacterium mobile]|uniref:glycosyltransferase family 2 protein n=1 Tax=Carnobacterium mobile TaxID=2750 RepID=UPI000692613F|nr:glycosyltransferase family 2 protein [Carnobacterium mobile]